MIKIVLHYFFLKNNKKIQLYLFRQVLPIDAVFNFASSHLIIDSFHKIYETSLMKLSS